VKTWNGEAWIKIISLQDKKRWLAFVNAVMKLRFLSNSGKFLTNRGPVSFSGRILLHGVRTDAVQESFFSSVKVVNE
jgi:hypothetical protein